MTHLDLNPFDIFACTILGKPKALCVAKTPSHNKFKCLERAPWRRTIK